MTVKNVFYYTYSMVHMFWFSNINFNSFILCNDKLYSFFVFFIHFIQFKINKKGNNNGHHICYEHNTGEYIHMDNDMSCFFILFYSISSNPSMRFNTKHNITHDDREYRYIMEKKESSQVKVQIIFMYLHSQRSSHKTIQNCYYFCY